MELLNKLTQTDGVSGAEEDIRALIEAHAAKLGYETRTDALGSLIAHKAGDGARIMVAAHMDEIGIIITYIDEKGFLRFGGVGGLYTQRLAGAKVRFKNGIIGVIGSEEEELKEKVKLDTLYIDIGAKNRAEAEKLVSIGDRAAFVGAMYESQNAVISKALDNRAGCFAALRAMERLSGGKDLYFVFTVQEEVGLRGAKAAAFDIDPQYAIAVDVTDTGDTPKAPVMAVKLGGGAAIKVMDRSVLCDAHIREVMKNTAKKYEIPYQLEIMADGGTDAGAMQLVRAGVKTGGISVPTRYIHSPSELAYKSDIDACAELLYRTIEEL
ncbi:MAG: M42 family metallopeptidase [Clostridiales bacterium]|nr:M42 family metallopeptidase [Clostridiales bacterium]